MKVDGLQSVFVDLSEHQQFFEQNFEGEPLSLNYELPYQSSDELGINRQAFLLFSEFSFLNESENRLNYSIDSINMTHIKFTLIRSQIPTFLKGFVVIYNEDRGMIILLSS